MPKYCIKSLPFSHFTCKCLRRPLFKTLYYFGLPILCNTLLYHLISPYSELRFVPYGQENILNSMPKIHSTAQSATLSGYKSLRGRRLSMESHRQLQTWMVYRTALRYYNAFLTLVQFLYLTCEGLLLKTNTASRSSKVQMLPLLSEFSFLLPEFTAVCSSV
jgi:hypothetical protein